MTALGYTHLLRVGRRKEGMEKLRRALDLAHRCGARRGEERARKVLRLGARPRRPALTGEDALTASERRVCQMAAEGLSNRDIAETLFVTVRTVDLHFTHAYQTLGVGSREKLGNVLETREASL